MYWLSCRIKFFHLYKFFIRSRIHYFGMNISLNCSSRPFITKTDVCLPHSMITSHSLPHRTTWSDGISIYTLSRGLLLISCIGKTLLFHYCEQDSMKQVFECERTMLQLPVEVVMSKLLFFTFFHIFHSAEKFTFSPSSYAGKIFFFNFNKIIKWS